MTVTYDQARHKAVNLSRILEFLRKTTEDEDWNTDVPSTQRISKWLKAQTILQGVKHCRSFLKDIHSFQEEQASSYSSQTFPTLPSDIDGVLDELQSTMGDMVLKFQPKPRRPPPLLPNLPLPVVNIPSLDEVNPVASSAERSSVAPPKQSPADNETQMGAVPPPTASIPNLVPPPLPSTSIQKPITKTTINSSFLNSNALQTDLADQLAQMAEQLKHNAHHFSSALAKDQAVLNETHEKIEQNMGTMKTERVRLRDHRGKSWNTTWLTLLSVVGVLIAFIVTFFVIRVT